MTPVFPYQIRRSDDGRRGELLLRLRGGKSAYIVHLTLEQARILAVEMRGLATDNCPLHHMAVRIAERLNAKVSHIVLKRTGTGDEVAGILKLATPKGLEDIVVDASAGLALAIHLGLPIFMDGDFSPSEPEGVGRVHNHNGRSAAEEIDFHVSSPEASPEKEPGAKTPIPRAFQDVINSLEIQESNQNSDGRPESGEGL